MSSTANAGGHNLRSGAREGIACGLLAAILFGVATPLSKELLGDVAPQALAGLLYLGAFAAIGAAVVARRGAVEARLQRSDGGRLVALVTLGGVLAPVFLLLGLERIQGTTASLLLNLEGVATLVIGLTVFGEHLSRRALVGAGVVFVGAGALAIDAGETGVDLVGIGLVALACLCWGIDNNLTQGLSVRDPFRIVAVKTGAAAAVNLTIAVAVSDDIPFDAVLIAALALGAVSYGVSIVLDAYALRLLGAARESIVFATAPFLGALLSIPILSEQLGLQDAMAGAAMAVGVALVATEHHSHWHVHEPLVHEHMHVHDEHHRHPHDRSDQPEPHSHVHKHAALGHSHEHVSDSHHRHDHAD
jgi:drug/metabolite transporter (DMT)-like permease